MFQPSSYQQAIFDFVQHSTGDLVVSAVPGSGKTTTSKELLNYIPPLATVITLAFNVEAAKQLQVKVTEVINERMARGELVPTVQCSTIHSLGNATLATANLKSQVKGNKYGNLVRQYLQARNIYEQDITQNLAKLIDMVRLTLSGTDAEALEHVMNSYEIDLVLDEDMSMRLSIPDAVESILEAGITICKNERVIDFTDMIWLPAVLDLYPKQYDYVLVDEAQDLSPAQRALVLKARRRGGRFVAVGDRNQAIYGFAGASLRSIDEIIEATNAIELPLSICYRCPKSVVAKAASIYSGIQAAPTAPEGEVTFIAKDKVEDLVKAGDLILCRLTAPLVEMCLNLLKQGKRANVRGKDLGTTFAALIEKIQKFSISTLGTETPFYKLDETARKYMSRQIEIMSLNADDNEMKIASLMDKIDTLLALREAYVDATNDDCRPQTMSGFLDYIKAFFAEDKDAQIILSTGHRAKGLEYPRVFILQSDKLPHPKAKTIEQLIQEHNLMYVMYTRAQESLFLVVDYVREPLIESVIDDEPETEAMPIEAPVIAEAETIVEAAQARRRGRPAGNGESTHKKDFRLPVALLEALKAVADDCKTTDTQLIIELLKNDPRIQQKLSQEVN